LLLNPADMVEAIAEIRQPGAVDKRGRRMVSQHPPDHDERGSGNLLVWQS
jgi:hypothetical protein